MRNVSPFFERLYFMSYRKRPQIRTQSLISAFVPVFLAGALEVAAQGFHDYCSILDQPPEVMWQVGGGYSFRSDNSAQGWKDTGVLEIYAIGGLAFIETAQGADFNLEVQADSRILQGFGGSTSGYPLNRLALFVEYSQRLDHGWGFRIDAAPGLYSDFQDLRGKDLALPFGFSIVHAVHDELSFLVGASVFPGFKRAVDPRLGFRWAPYGGEMLRIDLMYPESLLTLDFQPGLGVHVGARFMPWLEYQMKKDDPRDRLRFEENRVFAGFHAPTGEYGRWSVDIGYMFGREIHFRRDESGVSLDDTPYLGISYTSLF